MYTIELSDDELELAVSDSEYFTDSDSEYFSADEGPSPYSSPSTPGTPYSKPSTPGTPYLTPSSSGMPYSTPYSSGTPYSTPSISGTPYSKAHSSGTSYSKAYSSSAQSTASQKNSYHKVQSEDTKIKWTVDDSGPREKYKHRKHTSVDGAGMRNYNIWRRIILSGVHPREAASMAGIQFNYKQLKQKLRNQLFSIRLNIEHRVFFIVDEKERSVKILNIGGHSFS